MDAAAIGDTEEKHGTKEAADSIVPLLSKIAR